MVSSLLANRVRVATATTGTGTVTLGAKVSNRYATFAEAGITDAQVVTYLIEEGDDWEIGRGTYTASGTTLSRTTVLISSISGTVGTTKLTLAGDAEVSIREAKEDLDVSNFDEDTSPDGSADYSWMYDNSASLKKKVKPTNIKRTSGYQLVASGTVSSAATLDIVLTSYTGYKVIKVICDSFIPVTDDTELGITVSTDGGSTFASTLYAWSGHYQRDNGASAITGNSSAVNSIVCGSPSATLGISNTTNEGGCSVEITIYGRTAAQYTNGTCIGVYFAAVGDVIHWQGHFRRESAADTDAIRLAFLSGNIASGNYWVYALA